MDVKEIVAAPSHRETATSVLYAFEYGNGFYLLQCANQFSDRTRESNATNGDSEASWDKSRFQTDFDLMRCLGKGGYGVVFEVINKLDRCQYAYAIKRIVMPKSQAEHDAIIREVKIMAGCEHANIVKSHKSWMEIPPPGWQEREDSLRMEREVLSYSIAIDTTSTARTSHHEHVDMISDANSKLQQLRQARHGENDDIFYLPKPIYSRLSILSVRNSETNYVPYARRSTNNARIVGKHRYSLFSTDSNVQ